MTKVRQAEPEATAISKIEPYQLDDEELSLLLPEVAGALHGEFDDTAEVQAILCKAVEETNSRTEEAT